MRAATGLSSWRDLAEDLCHKHNAKLLYLTLFGSALYGTALPGKSDRDLRGIFLPSSASLALDKAPKSLHFSSGDETRRNRHDDVDIDLWSVQHWLLKLLRAGDTGAMDLLFAPSHASCVLYLDPVLEQVFAGALRLLDVSRGRAYAQYSLGQAKKYGLKGTRMGTLKAVWHWLQHHCPAPAPQERLGSYLDALATACAAKPYCTLEQVHSERALQLCGKLHMGSLPMADFAGRVEKDMHRYGARAEEAERNQGLDFKALSHALRALEQMKELLRTGRIAFPLQVREELIAVKEGKYSWAELESRIVQELETINAMQAQYPDVGSYEEAFAEACVLACYQPRRGQQASLKVCKQCFAKGFAVPQATCDAIQGSLDALEEQHGVKVLYAVESGSRAWGFASENSDFDVRFVYVHTPKWYLGLAPETRRDVIELGIAKTCVGELDINGWELRKTLKMFRLSNPPLLEWLSSPLIYREAGSLAAELRGLVPALASPVRIWHHYRSMMTNSLEKFQHTKPSVKTWFYALRALLAMRWIALGKGVPPMRFDLLMEGVVGDLAVREALKALVDAKRQGFEHDVFVPPLLVKQFFDDERARLAEEPPLAAAPHKETLDCLFRQLLMEAWDWRPGN